MARKMTGACGTISLAMAGCVLIVAPAVAQFTGVVNPGEFDGVDYWVGHGANQAAVVIDFHDGKVSHSYGWGLRWDGTINGEDALRSIVEADPRLDWNTQEFAFGLAVYGISFDANGNGGDFAFTGSDGGSVEDPEDHLQNGFLTDGFWAFYTTEETPATDEWESSMVGAGGRVLSNGSWDGWAFAPGYVMNAPRNPIVWVEPPKPYLESITLTDFTQEAPGGFTSQQTVTVEIISAYGEDIRLSETSGGGEWMVLDSEPMTFELSAGDGLKTVYATLRRGNALSDEVSAAIHLATGYNFATVERTMSSPTASDYLIFDVTYDDPVGESLPADPFTFGGSLAGLATIDMVLDEDPAFRVIARLSDATVDGSLSLTVPVFDAGGNVAASVTSAAYGVQNGSVLFARGDYNQDGVVNVEDVTALANDIVNK